MCTLTVVPAIIAGQKTLRLAFNRDEKRVRTSALSPVLTHQDGFTFVFPVDVPAGGTWIAANSAGLAFALLNVNLPNSHSNFYLHKKSRGNLIPLLLNSQSLAEVAARMQAIPFELFAPFRLFATSTSQWTEWVFRGEYLERQSGKYETTPSFLRTSSSFAQGDVSVELPRQLLWQQSLEDTFDILNCQQNFHRHQWPKAKHLSVLMERDDALTVSHTVVDLTTAKADMRYFSNMPEFSKLGFDAEHETFSFALSNNEGADS